MPKNTKNILRNIKLFLAVFLKTIYQKNKRKEKMTISDLLWGFILSNNIVSGQLESIVYGFKTRIP